MKMILLVCLSLAALPAFAQGLQSSDFVGDYTLQGDSSLPLMEMTFNADGSVVLAQRFPNGSTMNCVGLYEYETDSQELAAFYYCDGDQLLAQEIVTGNASVGDFSRGLSLQVKLFPSYSNDVTAQMVFKKNN